MTAATLNNARHSADDHAYMADALRLAARGQNACAPNPRVGCVLVADGLVVGRGYHRRAGGAHAEVEALDEAGVKARGATAYVTLEPCCHTGRTAPCTDALLAAGVRRVVAAMADPDPRVAGQGTQALRAAGVEVSVGLMEQQSRQLNKGFLSRLQRGRPWVRSKLAASLDGRTALADGASQWISGAPARMQVQRLRAASDAILTGIGTVLLDDPSLTVRDLQGEGEHWIQPQRVVLDSRLRLPPDARMLGLPGATRVFTVATDPRRIAALEQAGASVRSVPAAEGGVDLEYVLRKLAADGVNEVLVEAGAQLNGALLRGGLVDEWVVFMAGCVLGATARGMFDLPGLETMGDRPRLRIVDCARVGEDLCITVRPEPA